MKTSAVASVPMWATLAVLAAFTWGSTTVPLPYLHAWQGAAGVASLLVLVAALFPLHGKIRFAAAVVAVMWFFTWGVNLISWEILTDGEQVSVYALLLNPTIAIFIAWSWGRDPRPRPRAEMLMHTQSYGENTTPHYSPPKGAPHDTPRRPRGTHW